MAASPLPPATGQPRASNGSSKHIVSTARGNNKNFLETQGIRLFEKSQLWSFKDTGGKAGLENGIHEVGGSIPPGSTKFIKDLVAGSSWAATAWIKRPMIGGRCTPYRLARGTRSRCTLPPPPLYGSHLSSSLSRARTMLMAASHSSLDPLHATIEAFAAEGYNRQAARTTRDDNILRDSNMPISGAALLGAVERKRQQATDNERTTPIGLLLFARAYAEAGTHLHRQAGNLAEGHRGAPVQFNLMHSIELYLKAFLRHVCLCSAT